MKIIIETERLIHREFLVEDAYDFYNLNKDEEVLKFTGDVPFSSINEAEKFINNYDNYKKFGFGRWAVLLKEINEWIGFSGLKYSPSLDEYDIGFRFSRKHWGKGYATESAISVLEYGFNKLNIQTIVGRAMDNNIASHKVLSKLKMEYQKKFKEDGTDWVQYYITKEMYNKKK